MHKITEKEAIDLLKENSPDEQSFKKVLSHSRAVQKLSLEIASKLSKKADINLIRTGALLHDIGRFKCNGTDYIKHGIEGGKILRQRGLIKHAEIAETHIGAGIDRADITEQHLPLPAKDFVPTTIEQKIIAHADNLIFGSERRSIKDVAERFEKEVGKKCAQRALSLHNEIQSMIKQGPVV